MQIIPQLEALRAQVAEWRAAGQRVALVPTMGNLHAGHLALVKTAREDAERVVVSIFVNPTQFGPNEDLDRYPRTLEADCRALQAEGADVVYNPDVDTMYPLGQGAVRVEVPGLDSILCGEQRPGHFTGVATVVSMLFNQVQPDSAVFGQKDYQQLAVIRRMTRALHMPVEVIGVPTVRESDGLAMSTRNQYLTAGEREIAPQLYARLCDLAARIRTGERDFAALEARARATLDAQGFQTEYVTVASPDLTTPDSAMQHFAVLAAAKLGSARLIDNIEVNL